MFIAKILLLLIIIIYFLFAYFALSHRANIFEKVIIWTWWPNNKYKVLKNKAGYKKHQGKMYLVYGILFSAILMFIYMIENNGLNYKTLIIFFIIFYFIIIKDELISRKYWE